MARSKTPTKKPRKRNARSPSEPSAPRSIPPETPPLPLPPPDPDALTPDQERFVERYLLHGKAGRAYREIRPHVTRGAAYVSGYEWLRNPKIRREIDAVRRERRRLAQPHAARFLGMIVELLKSNLQDCFDESNNLRPIHDIPPETAQWLQLYEIRTTSFGSGKRRVSRTDKRCRLTNKAEAIKLLSQFLGLNQEMPAIDAFISLMPRELGDLIRRALAGEANLEEWVRDRKKQPVEVKESTAPLPATASLPDGVPVKAV